MHLPRDFFLCAGLSFLFAFYAQHPHKHEKCAPGFSFFCQGNFEHGCEVCPDDTYRGSSDLFATRSCIACPANSSTTNAVSQVGSGMPYHGAQIHSFTNPADGRALKLLLRQPF